MARSADIVIVGGGLAGASAAVMLGRTDHDVLLIDPHDPPRPDFRCEKFDPSQIRLLRRMGLDGLVLPAATQIASSGSHGSGASPTSSPSSNTASSTSRWCVQSGGASRRRCAS